MLAAGRYRLVELLGRGAMGEVWRARDETLGRDVAVKLLLDHTTAPDAVERFRREAQTAARLNHPNVVAAYDFGEEDGRGYLVMELVPGRSLRDELSSHGPLGVERARRLVGQAAAGLAAAHDHGVVHRDVKPGNLLLTAEGTVKVADFGIARAAVEASAPTVTGDMLGTTAYLAPERGTGGEAGTASDVYALGCVLYEALCGRPPFTGEPAAVVYQHVDAAPQPLTGLRPDVSAELADFTLLMLAKDPAARPTAARAAHVLAGAAAAVGTVGSLGGAGTAAEAPSPATTQPLPPVTEPVTATGPVPGAERVREPDQGPVREPRTSRTRRTPVLVAAASAVFLAACLAGFQLADAGGGSGEAPSPSGPSSPSPRQEAPEATGSPAGTPPPPDAVRDGRGDGGRKGTEAGEEDRKRREQAAKKLAEDLRKAAEERRKQREEAAKKEAEADRKQ